MQFLVVFACALAIASAGQLVAPAFYPGPQHLPVIGANGVPVDTPEVQHATAAHLAHKVEAHARNGDYAFAPVIAAAAAYSGAPLETPEVAAAKANHFAAHAEALARNGDFAHRYRRGVYAYGAYPYAAYGAYPANYAHYY